MDISEIVTGFPLDRVIAFDTETTGLSPERDDSPGSTSARDRCGTPSREETRRGAPQGASDQGC